LILGGSIADDIINGLDRSSVVLSCLSQKYYESPYCKKGECTVHHASVFCANFTVFSFANSHDAVAQFCTAFKNL